MSTRPDFSNFCVYKRFSKVISDPDSYFTYNDHWEIYDPTKQYPKGIFTANYRGPTKNYINNIYEDPEHVYVVAREVISEQDRIKLAPFCKCAHCTDWFGFMTGLVLECLKCDETMASDQTIKTARMAYVKARKN